MARRTHETAEESASHLKVDMYAVQCVKCFKWRLIPTLQEFEDIRSKLIEDLFTCNKKANVSCYDRSDLEYPGPRTWVIDRPNIPKTPTGFKREFAVRRDNSVVDCVFISPNGQTLKTTTEVSEFLRVNPEYNHLSPSDFVFNALKIKGRRFLPTTN